MWMGGERGKEGGEGREKNRRELEREMTNMR